MCEFKKGQIVYVCDDGKNWRVSHYSGDNDSLGTDFPYCVSYYYTEAVNGMIRETYTYCLSVEDYHKMLNQPKDKDLVWCWDNGNVSSRGCCFFNAKMDCLFEHDGSRNPSASLDNYEVIPREQWPQWAIEAYELLED